MNVSIGERWQRFVEEAVNSGRYGSASEVVREGLRLVEEREAKLQALRDTLNASIAEGGSFTSQEVGETIDADVSKLDALRTALIQGEQSGPATPFHFDAFVERKRRKPRS